MPETAAPASRSPQQSRAKAALVTLVKWLVFLAVLFFVGRALARQFAAVTWDELHVDLPTLALAAAGVLVAKAMAFVYYGLLLGRFCPFPGWVPMMTSVWVAQIAKYLPGKVGNVIGMVVLLRRHRVPGQAAVSTVIIIDGLSVILGIMVAIPLTLWEPVASRLPMAWLWCLLLLAAGGLCLHPRVFGAAGNRLLRAFGYRPFASLPKARDYLAPVVAMLGQFLLLGVGYWLMGRSIAAAPVSALPIFICAIVTASIAGFVAFFAPAGLGVQEGLLMVILAPVIGAGSAALIAVVMRLAQTLADVVLALAGYVIWRFQPLPEADDAG